MRFVRTLVLRKPNVAVDPEDRILRSDVQIRFDLSDLLDQLLNEFAERTLDVILVIRTMRFEPIS